MRNPSMPAETGLAEAIKPGRALGLLREPGVAASVGIPGSFGPAQLLQLWIGECPAQEWRPGGRPVVFATMRTAAAHLDVSERTARRYARSLRDAGAWKPVNPLGSGPKQGIDLSPLAEFIPRLADVAARIDLAKQQRDRLAETHREDYRNNRKTIREMCDAGLLTSAEARTLRREAGRRFRLRTQPSLAALDWHIRELRRLLVRLDTVQAELEGIQKTRAPKTASSTPDSRDRTATADAGAPSPNASGKERTND